MPRPFTRAQALQNRAFLAELRRTGNAQAAAKALGIPATTLFNRRAKHPAFAAEWDAALALAHAALAEAGPRDDRRASGEPRVTPTAGGRFQLRRHRTGRLTREHEQAFLAALSATANVRLSARAAGFTPNTFYQRRRTSPAFAREMRLALAMGYERVEAALIESFLPASHADDAWRHNEPPAIPPMTVDQALQLLTLHQKQVRLEEEPAVLKRRRGESSEVHSLRLQLHHEARMQRQRELYDVAEAARLATGTRSTHEPAPPMLPDLAQVTGWSKRR